MRIINETLRAYYDGKNLTDEEVVVLHARVKEAAKQLAPLGDMFHLAKLELIRVRNTLKSWMTARDIDK